MTATTMDSAPAGGGTASPEGGNGKQTKAQQLQSLGGEISNAGKTISSFVNAFKGTPLEPIIGPFLSVSKTLENAGSITTGIANALEENKENGVVSQVLGAAEFLLGGSSATDGAGQSSSSTEGGTAPESAGGASGKAAGDGEGKTSLVETLREKVGQLKEIWDEYYQDLFTKEGKLSAERAKQLALSVGDMLLGSKKMAKVRKAITIAEVIRDRAKAVMTALKSAPFPQNLPAIAFAVATGKAQEAAVKGQAHDGLDRIPSTGTYLLEKGERVVGSRLNRDLSDFLRFQQSTGVQPGLSANSSGSGMGAQNITHSPSVNLTINGDPDPDAVRSNRGALESMIREIYADHALTSPFD